MEVEAFQQLRPFLWHLTTRDNWISVRKRADGGDYTLSSTATLHAEASSPGFKLGEARSECQTLSLPWGNALIRDQAQLVNSEKQLGFPEDWDLGRYCGWLNEFVFFWPGNQDGPVTPAGKKHFRYHLRKSEVKLTFLKVDAEKAVNAYDGDVLFSSGSLGAPSGRKKIVPRGPSALVTAGEIEVPSKVVEIAFRDELVLTPGAVIPVAESRMREHLGIED